MNWFHSSPFIYVSNGKLIRSTAVAMWSLWPRQNHENRILLYFPNCLFRKFKFREAIYMEQQIAKSRKVNSSSDEHSGTWEGKWPSSKIIMNGCIRVQCIFLCILIEAVWRKISLLVCVATELHSVDSVSCRGSPGGDSSVKRMDWEALN